MSDKFSQMKKRLQEHQQYLTAQEEAEKNSVKGQLGQVRQVQCEDQFCYSIPIPDDLWIRCPSCQNVMLTEDFTGNLSVCLHCQHHFRIDAKQRIGMTVDENSFEELWERMFGKDPISFPRYEHRLKKLQEKTGMTEAVIVGRATIGGISTMIGAMDSNFLMGSMGSAVGEKITLLFELAVEEKLPVILFTASGGARMQEGIVSLMQMAKTAAAVGRHSEAGLCFLSVMTDPTTGGVTASFASLGDIILSEPQTLIGFAGRRVIEGTIAQALPEDFQRAEFILKHGFLDMIVNRKSMRNTLMDLLTLHKSALSEKSQILEVMQKPDFFEKVVLSATHIQEGKGKKGAKVNKSFSNLACSTGSECLKLIRHKQRPILMEYLSLIFTDVYETFGDRYFADDTAMFTGIGKLNGQAVTIIGHRKGNTLLGNQACNFGMPHPEGYRKALRAMKQAAKFNRPIITFIDTPGAYCGVAAEERGQGEAIARNLLEMMPLSVPVISVVIGEGGSGGALGIAVCDELAMTSNSIYSVISPRGFASLVWKDPSRENEAADTAHITALDLVELGICDTIIVEPGEGAHTDLNQMAKNIQLYLEDAVGRIKADYDQDKAKALEARYQKFRRIGQL